MFKIDDQIYTSLDQIFAKHSLGNSPLKIKSKQNQQKGCFLTGGFRRKSFNPPIQTYQNINDLK